MNNLSHTPLVHLEPGDILHNLEGEYGERECMSVVLDRYKDGGLEVSYPVPYPCVARYPGGPYKVSHRDKYAILVGVDYQPLFFVGSKVLVAKASGDSVLEIYDRLCVIEARRRRPQNDDDASVMAGEYAAEAKLVGGILMSQEFENDVNRTASIMAILDNLPLAARDRIIAMIVADARNASASSNQVSTITLAMRELRSAPSRHMRH